MKELNIDENYSPDIQFALNQELGEHTKECARNMAFKTKHDTCRDCPCHHYRKY